MSIEISPDVGSSTSTRDGFVHEGIGGLEVVFVPADPPRRGAFYCYERGDGRAVPGSLELEDEIDVVLPTAATIRRRRVPATRLGVIDAITVLRDAETNGGSASAIAWSQVISAALVLIARGRLYPTASPDGFDAWGVGPLTPSERTLLDAYAAALPAAGHATVLPGVSPVTIASPRFLIDAMVDALADSLVRTPAAPLVTGHELFASTTAQPVDAVRGWLEDASSQFDGGVDVTLRVELGESTVRVVPQVSSRIDPSLIVDIGAVFGASTSLKAHFGADVETDVLRTLRRGARQWPPLERLLRERVPSALDLDENELVELLGDAHGALVDAGIAVLWPASLVHDGVKLEASIGANPGRVVQSGFDLDSLVAFRWRATLDGEVLSEQEVNLLAEAKRGLVRLRGKYVVADPDLLSRLRSRREHRLSAIEALAAALSGSIELAGERVDVVS